jgi:hypothetical protein
MSCFLSVTERKPIFFILSLCSLCLCGEFLRADPPVAAYIFPAGGRRGTTVEFRVGGLFLHQRSSFEMLGPGVAANKELVRTRTTWFESPLLPLPDSQQAEDYPKDTAGRVTVSADAPLGIRYWRVATSQGATPALKFMVGDLPEVVEQEIEGKKPPTEVKLPVTINGRIFPREDIDAWAFEARKGQHITAEVCAARLGSPLDSRIEVLDPQGRRIAENDDALGTDSFLRFTAPVDGKYIVRIQDANFRGGQAYVYRLTLTAGPWVDRAYPLGGRRGSKTRFELAGQELPSEPIEIALPNSGGLEYIHRLDVGGKQTNPFLLDLSDLPEHLESEPNDLPSQAKPVAVPAVLNGRIDRPGDVDYWSVTLRKGEAFDFKLKAGQLGSPLNAVVVLSDAAGKELARADSLASGADPSFRFTAPADGAYLVRVEERFRNRGGSAYAYRLVIDHPPKPDFKLQFASDSVTVNRGAEAKMHVNVLRIGGFSEPVTLAVDGLPSGVTVSGTTIAANQPGVDLLFKADKQARICAARVTIRGSTKIGERTAALATARGVPQLDSVLLAVALPTPFKVVGDYDMSWAARGSVHKRHYKIERGGFTGPIEISLADRQMRHLQGVTGPKIIVPAGATEFDYSITLPPWMETGRTCRACVMAVGTIKDADGSEHTVSFHSVQQNEQIVAVVEPGKVDVTADRHSVQAVPDTSTSIGIGVARGKGLRGGVKVELIMPAHIRGVSAEPVTISADDTRGILTIRFANPVQGTFTMPLVIRATLLDRGQPLVAETRVEVLPRP